MTRKTVVELQAQADASFPDNTTAFITPTLLRTMIKDFLDSFTPAYAVFQTDTNLSLPLTTTPVVVPYQNVLIAQAPEFTASAPAVGQITRNGNVTTTQFIFQASFEVPANRQVTFVMYKDGVALQYSAIVQGTGASTTINLVGLSYSPLPAVFEMRAVGDVATTIVFEKASFQLSAIPVRTA